MRTPPRILVVDDNPTNLEVLRVRLNAQGYEVVTAVDGEEGLRRARELEPDLVLLDVMMPKLDGISVLKELKGDTALRFIPVILVTAKADTRDIVNGLEAGGDDYLTKPFEQAALVARVRSLLRIKELHDTVQLQAAQLKEWNRSLEERVATQVAEIERIGRLRRFLAPQVAQMIASSDAPDSLLASHRREVTVLFCDLRGFTAFVESSEPEEVTAVLREYHESMGELIFQYEGTLERFLGDGIMIIFNDPIPYPDHTERAVRLSLDMREKVEDLAKKMGPEGSRSRIGNRNLFGLRNARPGRLRASTRIHRERQRHKSRVAALRRGKAGPNRDQSRGVRRRRTMGGSLTHRSAELEGIQPADRCLRSAELEPRKGP